MKFSITAVLAFAAAALAKPVLLNSNYQIAEDTPFTLKWNNAQGPVTITLMTGTDKNNLKKVSDLATDVTDNEYTITLKNLPSGTYAIRITDSTTEPNYSPQFQYVGTGTLPSSSSSASSSVTRTSSASATSTASSSTSSERSSTSSSASSTSSSFTTTTTSSPSTTRATTQTTTPVNSNNGQRFASPLAFVLVTVAALVFFN